MPRLRIALCAVLGALVLPPAVPSRADEPITYRTPARVVADILTAPRLPRGAPSVSPDGARLLLPELPSLVPITLLAEPVEKLAGLEILPALRATRTQLKFAPSGFSIVTIADGKKVRAQLPDGARITDLRWSNRGDRIACAVSAPGGAELWIVEAATGEARALTGIHLNLALGHAFDWTLDDKSILCATVPADRLEALPPSSRVPQGPETRAGSGKAAPQRTARDVLRTADDQKRFAWYTASQLVEVPLAGGATRPLGSPASFIDWSLSPDDQRLLVVRLADPVPLGFPYYLFPRRIELWSRGGGDVVLVGEAPLNRRSAISSVAPLGPRQPAWGPDGRSLWFFSWQDAAGADPGLAVRAIKDTSIAQPGTDRLMRLDAPFSGTAATVATSDQQFDDLTFGPGGRLVLLDDAYAPRRIVRRWWIDPAHPEARHVLTRRSTEGVYDDPGRPLEQPGRRDPQLWTSADGRSIYLAGEGFRADGQRPFLDRLDLKSGKASRLFESAPDVLELPQVLLAADGRRFITSRQTNKVAPNYFARASGDKQPRRLSDYPDPAPALTASKRIQFKFTRPDSVSLNAEVVLPGDWTPGTRLPTIFWVYPNDYRSAAAASQNRRSPNRFPSQSPLNPEVLVTQGYAVLYPDIAVVGTNDRYVEEIQLSARAALDEAVRRGFCDPQRVGVGGHSYGAFSTANLLAHTDLFKAGIASDGAYNRSLTPFTFQAEERTLWEARDTYLAMSPFLYADRIQAPLLLLHNLDDTNVGTNPIQSERMFEALNGLGKVTALVEYPYEDHGPAARETVLDYWARVIEWFDRYVKGAGPSAASPATATPVNAAP